MKQKHKQELNDIREKFQEMLWKLPEENKELVKNMFQHYCFSWDINGPSYHKFQVRGSTIKKLDNKLLAQLSSRDEIHDRFRV